MREALRGGPPLAPPTPTLHAAPGRKGRVPCTPSARTSTSTRVGSHRIASRAWQRPPAAARSPGTGTSTRPWPGSSRRRIFRRTWQYAGHTGELAEPGSFVSTRAGDVPIVLVRDRDDVLRAFVNVCRHRGYLLCDGSGRRETLQCPYHAWTYDLDGVAAHRTAGGQRAGLRPGRARPRARRGRHVGAVRLRQSRSDGRHARGAPGRPAAARRRGRRRRRRARLPPAGGGRVRGELEGLRRELPRVLPLRRRAPELLEGDRRRARARTRSRSIRRSRASTGRRRTAAAASTTRPARSTAASSTCSSRARRST